MEFSAERVVDQGFEFGEVNAGIFGEFDAGV
jgi:hypothetical protein